MIQLCLNMSQEPKCMANRVLLQPQILYLSSYKISAYNSSQTWVMEAYDESLLLHENESFLLKKGLEVKSHRFLVSCFLMD